MFIPPKLKNEFTTAWITGGTFHDLLTRFVAVTQSRASGLWRLEGNELVQVGFGWADDMPHDVSSGFQEATRRVPLSQIGLGIVKAIVSEKPAIGRRDAQETGLSGSATWIAKFGANTSLAVPIRDAQTSRFIGVLAVSTMAFVAEGDALWQSMVEISEVLGQAS